MTDLMDISSWVLMGSVLLINVKTQYVSNDFKIIEDTHAINILNAPSPAATSSLSIGKSISELALKRF